MKLQKLWQVLCICGITINGHFAFASGGGEPTAGFFIEHAPEQDILLTKNEPGTLYPTQRIPYLIVWYWRLNNIPYTNDHLNMIKNNVENNFSTATIEENISIWLKARKTLIEHLGDDGKEFSLETKINPEVALKDYQSMLNCYADSFSEATKTLNQRLKQYANQKIALKTWLSNQDKVFASCSNKSNTLIPNLSSISKEMPLWIKQDTQYQSAAANFYLGNLTESQRLFDEIAKDKSSPWQKLSSYMQLRIMLRTLTTEITQPIGQDTPPPKIWEDANLLATQLLARDDMKAYHASIHRLHAALRARYLQPLARLTQNAKLLVNPTQHSNEAFAAALAQFYWDARLVFNEDFGTLNLPEGKTPPVENNEPIDLIDWLTTIKNYRLATSNKLNFKNQQALVEHSYQQWQNKKTLAWLFATSWQMSIKDSRYQSLTNELNKINKTHSTYYSAQMYLARHAYLTRNFERARQIALPLLNESPSKSSQTERNMLLTFLLPSSKNDKEFLDWALRLRQKLIDPEASEEVKIEAKTKYWDADAWRIYNLHMPVAVQLRIIEQSDLPKQHKIDAFESIWTRAVFSKNLNVARQAAKNILNIHQQDTPPIKPSTQKNLEKMTKLNKLEDLPKMFLERITAEEDKIKSPVYHDAEYIMPNFFNIDHTPNPEKVSYDVSWFYEPSYGGGWCSFKQPEKSRRLTGLTTLSTSPSWLTPQETQENQKEWSMLKSLQPDAIEFFKIIYQYAEKNKKDPLVPHALYIAIRMTKHSCAIPEMSKWSKEAFYRLKKDYPENEWSQRANYWYKGR